jgi:hypothetical protein
MNELPPFGSVAVAARLGTHSVEIGDPVFTARESKRHAKLKISI